MKLFWYILVLNIEFLPTKPLGLTESSRFRHWPHLQPMQATPLLTASHRILSSVARLLHFTSQSFYIFSAKFCSKIHKKHWKEVQKCFHLTGVFFSNCGAKSPILPTALRGCIKQERERPQCLTTWPHIAALVLFLICKLCRIGCSFIQQDSFILCSFPRRFRRVTPRKF